MNLEIDADDMIENLAIHFDTEPLNYTEGWSLDDENNKESAIEARKIVKRWLINKGLVDLEDK